MSRNYRLYCIFVKANVLSRVVCLYFKCNVCYIQWFVIYKRSFAFLLQRRQSYCWLNRNVFILRDLFYLFIHEKGFLILSLCLQLHCLTIQNIHPFNDASWCISSLVLIFLLSQLFYLLKIFFYFRPATLDYLVVTLSSAKNVTCKRWVDVKKNQHTNQDVRMLDVPLLWLAHSKYI